MPRAGRLDLAGIAQHVVQRGNNRAPCFHRRVDYLRYQQALGDAAAATGCRIHAYVLMTNHVHLLVTPDARGAVGQMMQRVGRRYVRALNDAMGRTGTLWEGRYKASLVDSERYLFACHRYIELNPVRASMVADPAEYRWSSVHMHLGDCRDPWLVPHPLFLALGTDAKARGGVWARWLREGIATDDIAAIRRHLAQERALGDARFQREAEQRLGRPVAWRPAGRPALSRN